VYITDVLHNVTSWSSTALYCFFIILFVLFFNCLLHVMFCMFLHYRSKCWGHPDNLVFPMKTHTFIYQMNCKIITKYSQDIHKVRHNDFFILNIFYSSNLLASLIASLTSVTVFSCAHIKRVFKGFLSLR